MKKRKKREEIKGFDLEGPTSTNKNPRNRESEEDKIISELIKKKKKTELKNPYIWSEKTRPRQLIMKYRDIKEDETVIHFYTETNRF